MGHHIQNEVYPGPVSGLQHQIADRIIPVVAQAGARIAHHPVVGFDHRAGGDAG